MRTGWQRVGAFVRAERIRQGYRHVQDFADACHLSYSTINALENGRRGNFDEDTIAVVENELKWLPGSIERILNGRRPLPARDADVQEVVDLWPRLDSTARSMLLALARQHAR